MELKILEDRPCGCEIRIHCHSRDDPEVQRALLLLGADAKKIPASRERQITLLSPCRVLYAEAVDGGIFLYTNEEVYGCRYSLAFLEKEYEGAGFFRCSKSMVVNLKEIRSLKSEAGGRLLLLLSNGEKIWVSRRYAVLLRRRLTDL